MTDHFTNRKLAILYKKLHKISLQYITVAAMYANDIMIN